MAITAYKSLQTDNMLICIEDRCQLYKNDLGHILVINDEIICTGSIEKVYNYLASNTRLCESEPVMYHELLELVRTEGI